MAYYRSGKKRNRLCLRLSYRFSSNSGCLNRGTLLRSWPCHLFDSFYAFLASSYFFFLIFTYSFLFIFSCFCFVFVLLSFIFSSSKYGMPILGCWVWGHELSSVPSWSWTELNTVGAWVTWNWFWFPCQYLCDLGNLNICISIFPSANFSKIYFLPEAVVVRTKQGDVYNVIKIELSVSIKSVTKVMLLMIVT